MKRPRPERPSIPADYLEPLVAALADPAVLAGIRVSELQTVAYQLALYFGVRRDAATSTALAGVYERLLRDGTLEARHTLVDELSAAVRGGATSVLALLPVLQRERDAAIVRAAALAFATNLPATPDDPVAGPRAVRALLDHAEEPGVQAGLVGALLALGDRRVGPLVAGTWRVLDAPAGEALLALPRTHATLLEAEWLLGWLEDVDPVRFDQVAEALAALPAAGEGRVLDLERELPVGEKGEVLTVLREWSAREAGAKFAPRFRDLARREGRGDALGSVRRAWGVSD